MKNNGQQIDGRMFSDYEMTDIHMHIIPEVDDGAWSMEMSEDMLRMSVMQGIRKVVAASHSSAFDWEPERAKQNFMQLKEKASLHYPEIELYLGCEIACSYGKMKMAAEKLEKGIYPSMNQTEFVLLEFSPTVEYEEVEYCTRHLRKAGWKPVIAHAERYANLFVSDKNADSIEKLKDNNCLVQINVYSILEEQNERIKENARQMLARRQVDFLGFDAHRTYHRPPMVESGLKYLHEHFEKDYVDAISFLNAIKYFNLGKKYEEK